MFSTRLATEFSTKIPEIRDGPIEMLGNGRRKGDAPPGFDYRRGVQIGV